MKSHVAVVLVLLVGCARDAATSAAPADPPPSDRAASTPSPASEPSAPVRLVEPDRAQLAPLVGREIVLVGVQSRTKIPQVAGVDVDGAYALSDRRVVARGILRRVVVTEVDPTVANRGTGTFYSLVDLATGRLAKTQPADDSP